MPSDQTGERTAKMSLRRDGVALFVLICLGGAFLFELMTLSGVPFARDIQLFFLPHKRILFEAFQDGTVPLWTSLINTGYPVLANFQSGVFYPPHWLFSVTPFLAGFNWLIVLHVLLGGLGTYWVCREIRFSATGSWIAAVSFMLGGYFVSLTNLVNVLQTAAWTPLMMVALIRHVRKPGPVRFGLVVAVYLLGFLAGAPYTFLTAAAMSAAFVVIQFRDELGAQRTALVSLSVAAVAVMAIAAVQIFPTLQMVGESVRAGGISFEEAGDFSIDPPQLLHLVFPNDFSDPNYNYGQKLQITESVPWLYSLYLGVAPLVLALFSWSDRERRTEVLFWIAVAILGVTLGLGRHLPLFRLLHEYVPGFSAFRYPEKFFLLTGMALPMLAAHGMSAVQRKSEGGRLAMIFTSSIAVLAIAGDVLWKVFPEKSRFLVERLFSDANVAQHLDFAYETWTGGLDELTFLVVAALLVMAVYRRGLLRRAVFTGLIAVLVVTDFWLAHRHLIPLVDPSFYRNTPEVARSLPIEDLRRRNRYWATPFDEATGTYYTFPNLSVSTAKWMWQQTVQPNTGALHGILTLDSGDAMHLEVADARRRLLRELTDPWSWRLMELTSVSRLYSPEDYDGALYTDRTALDSLPGYLYELRDPLPRAYIGKAVFHANEEAVLRSSIDPSRRGEKPAALLGDSLANPPKDLKAWARRAAGFKLAVASRVGPTGALRAVRDTTSAESVTLPKKASVEEADSVTHTVEEEKRASEENFGDAKILSDAGERVVIRVDPTEAGFLVLTDTPYPGWRVSVDGERRPLLRANWFFRAVPVKPGDEKVVFQYHSRPYRLGRLVSGMSVLLFASGLIGWGWRRRKTRHAVREND